MSTPTPLLERAGGAILCRGPVDLQEKRKRYPSGREEEDVVAQRCPYGTAIESRTHAVHRRM